MSVWRTWRGTGRVELIGENSPHASRLVPDLTLPCLLGMASAVHLEVGSMEEMLDGMDVAALMGGLMSNACFWKVRIDRCS